MKKLYTAALSYMVLGLAAGLFVRIYVDQIKHFEGETMLSLLHFHLLVLGMVMFLLVALFARASNLERQKRFKIFMIIYNIGLPITVVMMVIRGIIEVLGVTLSSGLDAVISGIAGIGHALVGIGIIVLLVALKKAEFKD